MSSNILGSSTVAAPPWRSISPPSSSRLSRVDSSSLPCKMSPSCPASEKRIKPIPNSPTVKTYTTTVRRKNVVLKLNKRSNRIRYADEVEFFTGHVIAAGKGRAHNVQHHGFIIHADVHQAGFGEVAATFYKARYQVGFQEVGLACV